MLLPKIFKISHYFNYDEKTENAHFERNVAFCFF